MQLEDACVETPQAEQLLDLCKQEVDEMRKYGTRFHTSCSKTMEGMTTMISGLTEMLEVAKQVHSQSSSDDEPNVRFLQAQNGLQSMIIYMGEVCGILQNMANDLSNNMMFPIDRFVRADLEALDHRSAVQCASTEQYKETVEKYSRLSQRKTDARARAGCLSEVLMSRAQARHDTLQYYAALQALKHKQSYLYLEPLLGYLLSFVASTRASVNAISKCDIDTNLAVFDAFVKSEHRDLTADQRRLEAQIDLMRTQQPPAAETAEDAAKKPPQTAETEQSSRQLPKHSLQKSGYLYVKILPASEPAPIKSTVAAFFSSSSARREAVVNWDRAFVFVQGGNLMKQARHELAGSSIADLQNSNCTVHAEPASMDDRFSVFAVWNTADKKPIAYFQCETDSERDDWTRVINMNSGYINLSRSASVGGTPRAQSAEKSPLPAQHQRAATVSQVPVDASSSSVSDSAAAVDLETALEFVPIQFHLSDEVVDSNGSVREAIMSAAADPAAQSQLQCFKLFKTRFVGSMQVGIAAQFATASRDELVSTAVRKMLQARVTHDMMQMLDLDLIFCEHCVAMLIQDQDQDQERHRIRAFIDLQRVVQVACHREDKKYFGVVVRRDAVDGDEAEQLECFAFESEESGTNVYEAFKVASRVAFQAAIGSNSSAQTSSPSS